MAHVCFFCRMGGMFGALCLFSIFVSRTAAVTTFDAAFTRGLFLAYFASQSDKDDCPTCPTCAQCPECLDNCNDFVLAAVVDYCVTTTSGATADKCRECLTADLVECADGLVPGCNWDAVASAGPTGSFAYSICYAQPTPP